MEIDAATLRRLVEYFNLRQFLEENPPLKLAIMLGIMCVMYLAARFVCALAQKKLEVYAAAKTKALQPPLREGAPAAKPALDVMDFKLFELVIRNSRRFLYLMILYWGLGRLVVNESYEFAIRIIFTTLCIWATIEFFTAFVPFNIDIYLRRHGTTLNTSQSRSLMPIVKGIIWAVGLTFLLDNLGFHVSTIIAGLGIVGVAVGMAGQAILADFFSYIVILLDKPFRIGDYVELTDGKAGDVEYMGPKTTHLRNLDGDLIVCANSQMTKGVLVNQGNIRDREVILNLGVAYETSVQLLKEMPHIIQETVEAFPDCKFDRACLVQFGASNLQYQIIYLVSVPHGAIRKFMNLRSQVNIAILERFAKEGISMAYPTEHVLFTNMPAAGDAASAPSTSTTSAAAPTVQARGTSD